MWARAADLKFLSIHRRLMKELQIESDTDQRLASAAVLPKYQGVPRWFTNFGSGN